MAHEQDPSRPVDPNAPVPPKDDPSAEWKRNHPLSDEIGPLPDEEGSLADVEYGKLSGAVDPDSETRVPPAEIEPLLSAEPVGPDSNVDLADLFPSSEGPADALLEGSNEIPYAELPPTLTGSGSDLFSSPPPASGSSLNLPGSSSDLFGSSVPTADPASGSNLFGSIPAAGPAAPGDSKSGSDVAVGKLEPVSPGSGWLDAQDAPPSPPAAAAPTKSKSEFELVLPAEPVESSDIFSSPVPTAKPADQSDVIVATAFGEAKPAAPKDGSATANRDRSSDIALTFDQPPGGSTIHDPQAEDDLPVADEVSESIFGSTAELIPAFDSGIVAKTPPLSDEDYIMLREDEEVSHYDSKFAGKAELPSDESHILSGHGEKSRGDSSAIRLDSPELEGTMMGGLQPEKLDSTEADFGLPEGPPRRGPGTLPAFELTPGGYEDALDATLNQPALGEDQSSIFSGGKPPGLPGADTSSVPIDVPDSTADAVEFSAHPDPKEADSGTLHGPSSSSVEIDWADKPGEGATTSVGLGASAVPQSGPPSSHILHGSRPPAGESASSSQVAAIEDLLKAAEAESAGATSPPKSGHGTRPTTGLRDPSVEIDWMAQSSEEVALPESAVPVVASTRAPAPPPAAKSRPTAPPVQAFRDDEYDDNEATLPQPAVEDRRRPEPAKGGKGGMLVGAVLGLVLGAGATAGAFLSGIIPGNDSTKTDAARVGGGDKKAGGQENGGGGAATGGADADAALIAADPFKAVAAMEKAGADTPDARAALGQARFFARVRELAASNASAAPNDAVLQKARADLEAAANDAATPEATAVKAMLHLGLTHELAGERDRARTIYGDGLKKFPGAAEVFQAALDRLAATEANANSTSRRLTPDDAEELAAAVTVLFAVGQDAAAPVPPAAGQEPEPGTAFWKAINAAAAGKYDDAAKHIAEAKKLHVARAKALAGRGLNPLTDPLEQIFPRACDDLAAYWALRKSIYEHPGAGGLVKKEGVAKALDQLAAAEKRSLDLMKSVTELKQENETFATDLKKAKDAVAVIEKDLKAEKAAVAKLEKDNKGLTGKVEDIKKEASKDGDRYRKQIDAMTAQVEKLNLDKRVREATLAGVAKELQGGKLLPAKYSDAELLAAAKSAVSRATGPDLSKLIPPELSAVAGTGLTAGHLVALANRVNKSEAAAAALAAELKKAKTDHDAEVRALADSYKAGLKKLTDTHAADLKKLKDGQALALKKAEAAGDKEIEKVREAQKLELKKLTDTYAAALKKLTDDQKAAAKKLADANDAKVKALEGALAVEKTAAASAEKRFRADLANALSPADALDIWLPLLTELRRPSDADGALDAANKVLKTATPGTDDAGKALTLAGLAQLLKGNVAAAKDLLTAARNTPAYMLARAVEDKQKKSGWATAADVGFATVTDPAAPARLPVSPNAGKRDAFAAARFLDAGITAYKAGRFAAAEKALAESAWQDPTDAVAWYFLGAARYAAGKIDAAKDDFKQGAVRELARAVPVRAIDNAISPIQGPARDALAAVRP